MAKFQIMYRGSRPGLDAIIEADTYKANGKFFEFLVNKEVIRSLALDLVLQIRRMDEDEEPGSDDAEDDLAGHLAPAPADIFPSPTELDELLKSVTPSPTELDELLKSVTPSPAELNELLASAAFDPTRSSDC